MDDPLIEVAGPRREHLGELSAAYAEHVADPVDVVVVPVGDLVRDGVLLPSEGAHLVGPTFADWLTTTVPRGSAAGS